jgi:hypothetical protein
MFNIPMGDYPLTADALSMMSAGAARQYQDQSAQAAAEMAERQAAHRNQYALAVAEMQLRERIARAQQDLQERQLVDQALSRHQQYSLALGQETMAQQRLAVDQGSLGLAQTKYADERADRAAFLDRLARYGQGMVGSQLTEQTPWGNFTLRAPELALAQGRGGALSATGLDANTLRGFSELADVYAKQANLLYDPSSAGASNLTALVGLLQPRVADALALPQPVNPLQGFQITTAAGPATNFTGTAPSGGRFRLLNNP